MQEQAAPAHGDAVAMVGMLEAAVDASALSADGADAAGTQHDWTLLAWGGQALSETTLVVPTMDQAVVTLRDADALVEDKGADETKGATVEAEDGAGDGAGDEGEAFLPEGPVGDETNTNRTLSNFTQQAELTTIWCDNNYVGRPSTEAFLVGCSLSFTLRQEGSTVEQEFSLPDDAWMLGLTEGATLPTGANLSITQSVTNTYVATASGLPTQLAVVETAADHETQTIYHITWHLKDGSTNENYLRTVSNDESDAQKSTQYMQLLSDVTFNVVGHIAGADLQEVFGADQADDFVLCATVNQQPVPGYENEVISTIANAQSGPLPGWSDSDTPLKWTSTDDNVSGTLSGKLPAFDKEGRPIVYSIEYRGPDSGDDYYQAVYNNDLSPNHGGDTSAAFPGGTLTLIHVGTTQFDVTKQWLDDDPSGRTDLTFTLWRYSDREGSSYRTAAQARLTPQNPDGTLGEEEFATITVPKDKADSSGKINLGELVCEKYGDLPKYDSDGYPYIYALREDTSVSGYEIVFGAVEHGTDGVAFMKDTKPSYRDAGGEPVYDDAYVGTRPDNDRFVYDRGTITNRKTGTVSLPLTKTWIAAAFQGQLNDVVCAFQAQSRPAQPEGENDDSGWTDVAGENGTVELEGWIAEQLTKQHTGTFPQYDAFGKKLEYRWVEKSVQQGEEDPINLETNKEFTLSLTDAFGKPVDVKFESCTNEETGAIENVFDNTTDQYVEKKWLDSGGNPINFSSPPKDMPTKPSEVKVNLYRDQQFVAEYALDGIVDTETKKGELDGVTYNVQEDEPWHLAIKGLPEYSKTGAHYSYLVIEQPVDGWHSERVYYPNKDDEAAKKAGVEKDHTTVITNAYGNGEETIVPVSKTWLDDSDVEHRLPSVVGVYAEDGPDTLKGFVALAADQGWYGELRVPGKVDWQTELECREIGLAESGTVYQEVAVDGQQNTVESVEAQINGLLAHKAYDTADEAIDGDQDNAAWANKGWNSTFEENVKHPRVATGEHVYEATNNIVKTGDESSG